MTDSVSVEQCDREAAFPYISRNSIVGQDMEGFLDGKYDEVGVIQAFARHRTEALRQSSEREERLRALVEKAFLEGYSLGGTPRDAGRSWELSESRQALEATNG